MNRLLKMTFLFDDMKTIFYDLESGPLPESELAAVMPEFEPAANLKDPLKIEANIAAKKAKWLEQAALSPLTGEILCIGIIDATGAFLTDERPEPEMIQGFWDMIKEQVLGDISNAVHAVGWNCHRFDLPFLIKRSLKHRISVPFGVRLAGAGRGQRSYWHEKLEDAMIQWQLGDREAESSLDSVAKFLGVGKKLGSGADFAFLWKNDRAAARAYVANDCRLLQQVHERMTFV